MKVALTYDLKDDYLARGYDRETCAEFDSIETIDAIDAFLKSRGCETERIGHIESLARALVAGKRWDVVFNIAEGLHGRGREAQVPALLDAYRIPYVFSDPLVLALTLDKALTKRVVRDAGVPTAAFVVIGGSGELKREEGNEELKSGERKPSLPFSYSSIPQFHSSIPQLPVPQFPLFVKPVAEGTGKGISAKSLVHDEAELKEAVADLQARFHQPVLAEQYLPGREFTVGITGTLDAASIIAVMEIVLQDSADPQGYTYENKQQYEERVRYRIVDDAEAQKAGEVALAAWRVLGCRDGGRVDIRSDGERRPHFLEVNPLAGLHPVLGDLIILSRLAGVGYNELLGRMLDSALSDAARFAPGEQPRLVQYA